MKPEDHTELLWTTRSGFIDRPTSKQLLVSHIDVLLERIGSLGVNIDPSNRFSRARKLLISTIQPSAAMATREDAAIGALLDAIQLGAISHYCLATTDAAYLSKAKLLLQDSLALPTTPDRNTPGRDTQFELFSLACWNSAGVQAKLGEPPLPDITLQTPLGLFGAETKKIKSVKAIKDRARKASKQLRSLPHGGILMTDLTQLFPGVQSGREFLERTFERRVYSFMKDRLDDVRAVTSSKSCFAWTAFAQCLVVLEHGVAIAWQWKTFNLCNEHDARYGHIVKYTSSLSNFCKEHGRFSDVSDRTAV